MRVAERIELDAATERELGVLSKGRRVEAGRPSRLTQIDSMNTARCTGARSLGVCFTFLPLDSLRFAPSRGAQSERN